MDARSTQRGMMGNPETSQLLLIVSDGRGLFSEGMETVKSAVRQAREANIFLVFVVIDNPPKQGRQLMYGKERQLVHFQSLACYSFNYSILMTTFSQPHFHFNIICYYNRCVYTCILSVLLIDGDCLD